MKRIAVVIGTRPEAIKMAPVIKALREVAAFKTVVVTTAQHREMLDQVFAVFGERADYDLNLMAPGQTLAGVTTHVLGAMTTFLQDNDISVVLVHGDTTTALATAIASVYARVPLGHVEAGLRTHDLSQPWPEEFNRAAIAVAASYSFAPSPIAQINLLSEYNRRMKILITGNTGIDSLLYISDRLDRDAGLRTQLEDRWAFLDSTKKLILVTAHRRENFGSAISHICDGLLQLAQRSDLQLCYPVHPNPEVRQIVYEKLKGQPNIYLSDPVDYFDMVFLMKRSAFLITDSGGLQEEAPALGRPVLALREVTERPEVVATNNVTLVGSDPAHLVRYASRLLEDPEHYRFCSRPVFPYGDGTASIKIASFLENELLS